MKFRFSIFILMLVSGCSTDDCKHVNSTIQIIINKHILITEVASTSKSLTCGLSFRDHLPKNHGMLFLYPEKKIIKFWMKNTSFPLSIAFLDLDGVVLEVRDMEPSDLTKQYWPSISARYALEVNQGWFASVGIKVGDRIDFLLPND